MKKVNILQEYSCRIHKFKGKSFNFCNNKVINLEEKIMQELSHWFMTEKSQTNVQ